MADTTDRHEMSTKEAAGLAGITPRHMRRLVKAGTIRGHQVSGWLWVVDRADLARWVDKRKDQDRQE